MWHKIKWIIDIIKLCKKYWYIFDPLLSAIMSGIISFYGWAVWFFGKPAVLWFSFLLGLLLLTLLRLIYCLINCAYSNWKIQKEIDKIEKDHQAKMAEMEKEAELAMKKVSYTELTIVRQKKVDELVISLPQSQNKQETMAQIFGLAKLDKHIEMNVINEIAEHFGIEKPTPNQKSIIKAVMDKYDNYQPQICALFEKIFHKIKEDEKTISKQTIEFLTSITDNDLEILKKQFRYIVFGAGICYFEYNNHKVAKYLANEGLLSNSYSLRFYGDIYKDEMVSDLPLKVKVFNKNQFTFYPKCANVFAYVIRVQDIQINCIISKEQFENNKEEIILEIPMYVTLTNIGVELYNLLKDELTPPPVLYLKHNMRFLKNKYKNYTFTISKPNTPSNLATTSLK